MYSAPGTSTPEEKGRGIHIQPLWDGFRGHLVSLEADTWGLIEWTCVHRHQTRCDAMDCAYDEMKLMGELERVERLPDHELDRFLREVQRVVA